MRFIKLLGLSLALAVVFVPTGAALDYNDESEEAPRGEVGMLYHFELHSHSGCDDAPYRYVIESGTLPPGLKLTPNSYDLPNKVHTGLVDGMPTEGGTWTAWIALKDHCGNSAELLFTFEIWPQRFFIGNDKLPAGAVGSPYSATLTTTGVRSNVTWKVTNGSLPAGLTLNSNGTITGTPTAVGSSTFTLTATGVSTDPSADGTRIDSKQLTLNITQPLGGAASRRVAEVGVPFRGTLVGSGGQSPYTWAATGLPAGLAVDAGGSVTGTPTAAGSYAAQLTLTDANGTLRTVGMTFRVVRHLAITTKKLHVGVDRTSNAALAYRGGQPPVRFTIVRGHLLPGLKLERRTGRIVGVAHAAGSTRIVVRGRDSLGGVSTQTVVVTAG
jgi:hypothetical protein